VAVKLIVVTMAACCLLGCTDEPEPGAPDGPIGMAAVLSRDVSFEHRWAVRRQGTGGFAWHTDGRHCWRF
jgi:hypothetical protein